MNKTIIGLNLKYLPGALIASVISAIAAFLPYVSNGTDSMNSISAVSKVAGSGHMGVMAVIFLVGVIATFLMLALAALMALNPSIPASRAWLIVGAVQVCCYTLLMFGSKSMFTSAGILSKAFLVKHLAIGYWVALVAAYCALVMIMKMAKVNPGYVVLVILSVIWIFPILWIVLTSLRGESGYYVGYFIPRKFTLDNYKNLFVEGSAIPFAKWWLNTLFVAVCTCILSTLIILATSYTLSRTRFQSRKTLMQAMLIIGMFPGFMSMVAVYNILKGLGLAQTLTALIVVSAAGAAMGYYICKGFFDTIPKSLDEAAIIDGATRFQIFTRITIPLSKPIVIYTILTSFLGAWSDYIFPSMVMGDNKASYTVALGLYWMTDFHRIDAYYTQFAAGAILVAIPIVALFIWLQKYYVEGLSGAVKG